PAAAATGTGRIAFAAAYLALATLSTSLVLHLREVRYYPLVVFQLGLLILIHLRRTVYHEGRRRRQTALIAALLIGLFLTFYPVCAAAAAALLLDAARRARKRAAPWRARLRAAAREISPVAIAALAIAPLLVFFETLHVAAAFSARLQFSFSMFAD